MKNKVILNKAKCKISSIGIGLVFAISPFLSSCSDSFLDHDPDERKVISTEEDVQKLLMSSYPYANFQWIAEISSDNLIDNQSPHLPSNPNDKQILSHYNYPSYSRWDDELFRFEPASMASYGDTDSPGRVWGSFYKSVASANFALEAIDLIAAKNNGTMSANLKKARGEALLIRAYDHFMLVNLFSQAYKDADQSRNDVGVPYVTEIESQMIKKYDRGNVTDTYAKIQKDLEEGLQLVDNSYYNRKAGESPIKYHFNEDAAHAFAARFYLFTRQYDKVIEHANAVLGTDSVLLKNKMMDYSVFDDASSFSDYGTMWQHPNRANNLMLLDTYSSVFRRMWGYRYSVAGSKAQEVLMVHSSPLWSAYICPSHLLVGGGLLSSSANDYGFISSKGWEQFQYTNKIAGIGYAHIIVRAFTVQQLLLERAEAYAMSGRYAEAEHDLICYWNNQFANFSEKQKKIHNNAIRYLNSNLIEAVYSPNSKSHQTYNYFDNWDFTQANVSSSFVVPSEAVKYMNCINDFRRLETVFEGLRFFDLKRWGMEWEHVVGLNSEVIKMKGKDPRRALEPAWEVLSSGLESSRKGETVKAPSSYNVPSMNVNSLIKKD